MPILTPSPRGMTRTAKTALDQAKDSHRSEFTRVIERARSAGEQRREDLASIKDAALRESAREAGRKFR